MIKMMVVDDHFPTLVKLLECINVSGRYQIIGTAGDGHELIRFCYHQKELPEIVLLDVQMQKMDGVTAMEFIGHYFPSIKVIAVSSHIDERVISDMLAGGAWGYVFKDKQMSKLGEALLEVESGRAYVDSRFFFDTSQRNALIEQRRSEKEILFDEYKLSRREKEILALLVSNMDYHEISEILHISPKTIENIVNAVTKKLNVTNGRAGLLLHSLRLGLTRMVNLRAKEPETKVEL